MIAPSAPQIRAARLEDEPALRALGGAATSVVAPPLFAGYLREGGSFVALADGAVVGYLLARPPRPSTAAPASPRTATTCSSGD